MSRWILIISLLLAVVVLPATAKGPDPKIIDQPEQILELVRSLSSQTPFAITSLAYMSDDLYAASNIGLLQIHGQAIARVMRWDKTDGAVGGVWYDHIHNLLFVHDPRNQLMRVYDGHQWSLAPVPSLPKSFSSRGAVPRTFKCFSSDKDFYLVGRGAVWRWAASEKVWKSQLLPPIPELSGVIDAFFANGKLFSLVRHEVFHGLITSDDFESDSLHYFADNSWHVVPNRSGSSFFSMSSASVGDSGYICTESHRMLRATEEGIFPVANAPICEQVSATRGRVVVYSRQGFLAWDKGPVWLRLADPPVMGPEPEHPLAFAVHDKKVAYAINSIVDKRHSDRKKNQFQFTTHTRLWVSDGGTFNAVVIPGLQTMGGLPQTSVALH
jgi:hypothetical protein